MVIMLPWDTKTDLANRPMELDPPRVYSDAECSLGEAPVWDTRTNCLYWLDIRTQELFCQCWDSTTIRQWHLPCVCSAIFLLDTPSILLLASEKGLLSFNLQSEAAQIVAVTGNEKEGYRSNDGGVDPVGRIWQGTMSDEPSKKTGAVYRWNLDGQADQVWADVHIPNTFVWSKDGNTLISADSFQREIRKYSYDVELGTAQFEGVLADLSGLGFEPDGSAIDIEDRLWNAQWNGSRVACYELNGTELAEVRLPVTRPTSCCFGGPDMNMLFITSARDGLSKAELSKQPLAGAVLVAKTSTIGLAPRYAKILAFSKAIS